MEWRGLLLSTAAIMPCIIYDGKSCVSTRQPSCPPGYSMDGKNCVTESRPVCPPSTTFDGKSCVAPERPSCQYGTHFNGKSCTTPVSCRREPPLMEKLAYLPIDQHVQRIQRSMGRTVRQTLSHCVQPGLRSMENRVLLNSALGAP